MRPLLFLTLLLAACGGRDPVTDKDDAASAPAIDASVNAAANQALEAQLNGAGNPNDPETREALARNLVQGVQESENRVVPPAQPAR